MRIRTPWAITALAFALPLLACQRTETTAAQEEADRLSAPCRLVLADETGVDAEIARLRGALRSRPDATAAEQLGYRFVARARLTNDPGFYTLAEQAAGCMNSIEPGGASALLLRGHALHQMHRFAEAEAAARKLIAAREFVLDHGLLGDALMEQGRLDEAAVAYQKMIDLKPFYQSYTRAAHLRWLRGDLTGAIQLMHNAVRAASPRDRESIAWAYTRLAFYELQQRRLTDAARMGDAALTFVPDYAAALLVRGRILLAESKPRQSVEVFQQAASANPLPEYQWMLADALRLTGRDDEASAVEAQLIRSGATDDPRTVALFLATRTSLAPSAPSWRHDGQPQTAVDLARRELATRADVFTLDALAWALFAAGETREASGVMAQALAEGTHDGRLFLHAAAIAAADGRTADAARWTRKARLLRFTLLPSELALLERGITPPPAR